MLCPFCRSEIPDDAKKCMNCGEWVNPTYRTPKQEPQGCFSFLWETFLNLMWFLFIAGIITVAILLFMQYHGQISLG